MKVVVENARVFLGDVQIFPAEPGPAPRSLQELMAETDRELRFTLKACRDLGRSQERLAVSRRAAAMYRRETGRTMPGSAATKRLRKKRLRVRPDVWELMWREQLRGIRRELRLDAAEPDRFERRCSLQRTEMDASIAQLRAQIEVEELAGQVHAWLALDRAQRAGAATVEAFWCEVERMDPPRRLRFERFWRAMGIAPELRPASCPPIDPEELEAQIAAAEEAAHYSRDYEEEE